ncbi:hypothetical protein CTAYLR_000217 [Chrysophaeum taylorii]|uniref:Cysteine-rich PDZ-binding protein n=1 Tax=Chrysophaeum taylorii TaxID=2483200 RepID=A0AAD7XL35_9STRA|nr:hypothetical protein CTAYLR_000217 [Chrysophaeum taylorii]
MVCKDCEKKLSKVIVPDVYKVGARNTTGGEDGGRATGYRNSLLQVRGADQRFMAGTRACRICKTKVAQDAHYCQDCAFHHGICAMCGKRVDDLRFDRRGLSPAQKRKLPAATEDRVFEDGGYGTSERFAKKSTQAAAISSEVPEEERPPIDARAEQALETVANAIARNAGRTLGQQTPVPTASAHGWASATDVASGRVYYYHARTKQTSWVWPPSSLVDQRPPFLPTVAFAGQREGYVFTTRDPGLGYYRDDGLPMAAAAKSDHGEVTSSRDDDAPPAFIPTPAFAGRREGYVYTKRAEGLGYFLDR